MQGNVSIISSGDDINVVYGSYYASDSRIVPGDVNCDVNWQASAVPLPQGRSC